MGTPDPCWELVVALKSALREYGSHKYEFFSHRQLERVTDVEAQEFAQTASNLVLSLMQS